MPGGVQASDIVWKLQELAQVLRLEEMACSGYCAGGQFKPGQ